MDRYLSFFFFTDELVFTELFIFAILSSCGQIWRTWWHFYQKQIESREKQKVRLRTGLIYLLQWRAISSPAPRGIMSDPLSVLPPNKVVLKERKKNLDKLSSCLQASRCSDCSSSDFCLVMSPCSQTSNQLIWWEQNYHKQNVSSKKGRGGCSVGSFSQ